MSTFPQFGFPFVPTTTPNSQLLPSSQAASPTSSCCESGRPIMTDPTTGQTVCSCQYDSVRLLSTYPRMAAGLSMYGSPYADQTGYVPAFSGDPSAFYPTLGFDVKDAEAWRLSQASLAYPYDPSAVMAAYPYADRYGAMDNGIRRKNATRETTSTLKAWLYEHRKNPYPTKGEKIMLAIITKMTLTQVSTWFANARRRLKKENKMTWEPRNRIDDDDDDDNAVADARDGRDSDSDRDIDREECTGEKDSQEHRAVPGATSTSQLTVPLVNSSKISSQQIPSSQPSKGTSLSQSGNVSKPKIWSLADIATSDSPPSNRRSLHNQVIQPSLQSRLSQGSFLIPGSRHWPDARSFLQQSYPVPGVAPVSSVQGRVPAPTPVIPAMMSPPTPHKIRLSTTPSQIRRAEVIYSRPSISPSTDSSSSCSTGEKEPQSELSRVQASCKASLQAKSQMQTDAVKV